jgi:hypothetical protein
VEDCEGGTGGAGEYLEEDGVLDIPTGWEEDLELVLAPATALGTARLEYGSTRSGGCT